MIPMPRSILTAASLGLCLALAQPAAALDLESLTDAERTLLRAEIRDYLLANPEVIMEAVAVLEQREAQTQAQADSDLVKVNAEALFNDPSSWVGGNPEGDLTLVEFMDYRCSYCRRAFDDVKGLLAADGNIRFIIKEFPILGEESVLASRFAIATRQVAGDEAYKSVHDALMTYSGSMNETGFSRLADTLGLDATAILAEMNSDAVTQVIAANHALGQRMQISGTPSFVLGDQMLRGYLPQDAMQRIADEIRAQ
ncbi:Protein-disulfide isomerase [Roseovarius mucosus DSM 17069]|jgi:protein-disulfide isomerase|uniref:Protein-disulfide isomerase n=1 Tax=Roseovarius mucosus DSM 17069 TaxID=1288298 RepID=A0A0A0HNA8_9RHOB|nr:DsbA family protein [Roseovarius mucosus]KGM88695.1 Protein-disulfide isomerase [Roseovarius mucosus DSM 17069]